MMGDGINEKERIRRASTAQAFMVKDTKNKVGKKGKVLQGTWAYWGFETVIWAVKV